MNTKRIIMVLLCLIMLCGIAEAQVLNVQARADEINQFAPEIWLCRHMTAVLANEMKPANITYDVVFGTVFGERHVRVEYWDGDHYCLADLTLSHDYSLDNFIETKRLRINQGIKADEKELHDWITARFGEILVYAIAF